MAIFYANDSARAALDQHGNVHFSLTSTSPVACDASVAAVLPRRVAEELLKQLAEALLPDEPEAKSAEPELPLTGAGWLEGEDASVEIPRPWRERFGVES